MAPKIISGAVCFVWILSFEVHEEAVGDRRGVFSWTFDALFRGNVDSVRHFLENPRNPKCGTKGVPMCT